MKVFIAVLVCFGVLCAPARAASPFINTPTAGSAITDATPTFTGGMTTQPGDHLEVLVEVIEAEQTVWSTTAPKAAGEQDFGWEATPTEPFPDGHYTVRVTQTADAGEPGVATADFEIDSTAPALTVGFADGTETRDQTPQLTGAAGTAGGDLTAVGVEITRGDEVLLDEEIDGSTGAWAITAPFLAEGAIYTLRVSQADDLGNTATIARTFRVDATPPAMTVETPPSPTDPGTTRPVFAGTGGSAAGDDPAVTVAVTGPAPFNLTLPVADGRWSGGPAEALPPGTYTGVIRQADAAGNVTQVRTRFSVYAPPPTTIVNTPRPFDSLAPNISLPRSVKLKGNDVTVSLGISQPGVAILSLRTGKTVLTRRVAKVFLRQPTVLRLKLTRSAKRKLLRNRTKLTLAVHAKNIIGTGRSASGKVKLKR